MSNEQNGTVVGWNIFGFMFVCTIVLGILLIFAAGVVVGSRWGKSPIHIEHLHSEPWLQSNDLPVDAETIKKEVASPVKSRTKR